MATLDELATKAKQHVFLLVFVGLLLIGSLIILRLAPTFKEATAGRKQAMVLGTLIVAEGIIWAIQLSGYLSLFAAILCSIIVITLLALFGMDHDDHAKFKDHFRFFFMIFIYSGFWVLYFQMFDSVLWYVQAYVDASSLNSSVNSFLSSIGLSINWWFDVEHVTVINAGTIILLQLIVSNIVKNTRAMPTMMVGIGLGTLGMGILAISTGIWVFIAGIVIFSIGEMTAHPKFISYVGQTAPKARVAMYMGYLFLYGVIGSSIGGVVGANLYVKFVDELNQPRTLWLIFTGIGVATIVGLLLYNRFLADKTIEEPLG
jgi:dipeptide/tripeptide permease